MKALKVFNSFAPIGLEELPSSVQAGKAWERVSNSYAFLSSLDVTRGLGDVGLYPYMVQQAGTRIESKDGYTKHLMRFRSNVVQPIAGNVYPEVVLVNAHDRASSFILELGLFRCVCMNGLVVSFGNWGKYKIRHVASSISDVLIAARSIVDLFPMIESKVTTMQSTMLTHEQRTEFAERAIGLRWETLKQPFEASTLLSTRRAEDSGTDVWSTFNVIQENLLRGQRRGYGGVSWYSAHGVKQHSSRAVKSIDLQLSLNHGLWELAEGYTGR